MPSHNSEQNIHKKEYNLGLAVLKSIMCFLVILSHFYNSTNTQGIPEYLEQIERYAAPIFMLLSFIFSYDILETHQKAKICKRFERLLIPQIGWAIIYWIIYFTIDLIWKLELEHGFSDLIWQIFCGHSLQLNASMWYQIDLIYLTLLFLIVIIVFKKMHKKILCILCLFALFAQYSGINMIFDNYRFELKYPLGRFLEMLPLAVTGFMISSTGLLNNLKENKLIVAISSFSIIILIKKYEVFSYIIGYGYSGIEMIVVSCAFVSLFYIVPFSKLNKSAKVIIGFITKYTLGIYCMHRLIGTLLNIAIIRLNWSILKPNSFTECVFIYIISFMFSHIGVKILSKTNLTALFN